MITITKDTIESVVRAKEENRKLNPWDGDGDEQRMFAALIFDEAKKHVPVFAAMFMLSTMMLNPGRDSTDKDKEKAVNGLMNDPTLIRMVSDLIYLGYQIGVKEKME